MKKWISGFLAALLLLTLCGCAAKDYKAADELFTAGDYKAASSAYHALEDYKDSAEKADECDYLTAKGLLNDGDHASARKLFSALGEYKDSADWVKHCDYLAASDLYNAGDYNGAVAAYRALGSYEDSADMAQRAQDMADFTALCGEWRTEEIDILDDILASLGGLTGGMDSYFSFSPFTVIQVLTLNGDGTCISSTDPDCYTESMTELRDELQAGFSDYFSAILLSGFESEGLTKEEALKALEADSMDDVLEAMLGMSMDEYMDEILPMEDMLASLEDTTETGTFEVKDGTLVLTFGSASLACEYDLDSGTVSNEEADIVWYKQ